MSWTRKLCARNRELDRDHRLEKLNWDIHDQSILTMPRSPGDLVSSGLLLRAHFRFVRTLPRLLLHPS
jgi:hypothetical protein